MAIKAFDEAPPDSFVIICKDTAISSASSATILDVVEATIESSSYPGNQFDLFYLAKWMDRCDQYTNVREVGANGLKLVDTISPNGVLCLMFSPQGVTKFLSSFSPDENPIINQPLGQVLNSRISGKNSSSVFGSFKTSLDEEVSSYDMPP